MKTLEILDLIEAEIASAIFSNRSMEKEVNVEDTEHDELKKLVNRSTKIVAGRYTFTRKRVVDQTWDVDFAADTEYDLKIPADFMEDSLESELDKIFKAEDRRAKRRGKRGRRVESPTEGKERRAKARKEPAPAKTAPTKTAPAKTAPTKTAPAKTQNSQRQFIMDAILKGLSNKEIFERLLAHFGDEIISEKHKTHPAWYRSRMRRDGLID